MTSQSKQRLDVFANFQKVRVILKIYHICKHVSRCFDWLVITTLRRRPVQKSPHGTVEQRTWPVLNCALPSPGQGQFVSPAIRSGFEPNSMISQSGWLAFFDLQLCCVRCGDEFGLELN